MQASVCMYCMSLPTRPSSLLPRPIEDTTPAVIELVSESGEPKAATNSPGLTSLEFPRAMGLSLSCNIMVCVAKIWTS